MILVTGATGGQVGSEVVRLLLQDGQEVMAVTREPAHATATLPAGARVVVGNPSQPRALVDPGHAGRSYVLTGPQSLTQPDKVRMIGEAIGRQLSWVEISPDQLRQTMLAQGVRADVPDRLVGSLADYARHPGPTTTTVQEVLGRPARTFAEWAAGRAGAFRNEQAEWAEERSA